MKQIVPSLYVFDEIGETVHAYLWEWEGGATLIDTGMPSAAAPIERALVANGYPLHQVKRIIITHCDVDHMGSAAALRKATGASVACHTVEKAWLEEPTKRGPSSMLLRPVYRLVTLIPAMGAKPVTADELLIDGQELPEGFTVIHTPGHTPGHISLLHRSRRLLIAGDCLNNRKGKLAVPPPIFTPDMKNAQRSVWKLAKKHGDEIDTIVFGHGDPVLNNGGARIKALATQIFSSEI